MSDDPWSGARERTRREVAAILAPRPRTCARCGAEELTASRSCPACGAPYASVAEPRRIGRRAVLTAAAILMAGAALVVVVVAPAVDEDKQASAAAERQRLDAARAGHNAALRREQQPRTGGGERPAGPPTAASRRALLGDLEAAVERDARARVAAGELRGPILAARCEPYPRSVRGAGAESRLSRRVGRYDCLAVTSRIPATELNRAGSLGHPFRARVDFGTFRWAFCKVSPPPGEKAIPRPGAPAVPRACSAP